MELHWGVNTGHFGLSCPQSSRSSQVTIDQVNYWSDDHSVASDQDKHDVNNVDFIASSSPTGKFSKTVSHSRDKDSSTSKFTAVSHGSAMKLGTKKASIKTDRTTKSRQPTTDPPGSEFDIMQVAVRSSEPDYFADMEPAVSFKAKDSKIVPLESHADQLSSKLAMLEDTSQVCVIVSLHLPRAVVVAVAKTSSHLKSLFQDFCGTKPKKDETHQSEKTDNVVTGLRHPLVKSKREKPRDRSCASTGQESGDSIEYAACRLWQMTHVENEE